MKLYVIRHGQTNDNVNNIINGRSNEELNETGKEQARQMKNKIEALDIDLIICSPLIRTKQTANIINSKNIPVIFDERIIERDTGEYTNKHFKEIDREDFYNYYSSTKYKYAETINDVCYRVEKFLDDIKIKYKDKNILLVTHGGTTRAIYAYFNGIPKDGKLLSYGQNNCEIREYEL